MSIYTTIYLVRHSDKFSPSNIGIYNTSENDQQKTEKKMLSIEGERRAYKLSQEHEFDNLDVIYSSNYVRAMQTAKYFLKDKLKLNIDVRFNERTVGTKTKETEEKYPDFFTRQYHDIDFKLENGESQREVSKRMLEAFNEVIERDKGKRVMIVSHGTAISFLLMQYCKLEDVKENKYRHLTFNGHDVIKKVYDAPEVFKVTLDENNKIIDIINIEFNLKGEE